MIHLEEKFDGHIILYCKGHYSVKDVDFLIGLRRIWAVRCGLSVEDIDNKIDEYIADRMYLIIQQVKPNSLKDIWQIIHKDLADNWHWNGRENLTPIQKIIWIYRDIIWRLQISKKGVKNYKRLIKLPKPQKRLFKKIVSGKAEYNDYKLVK